MNDFVGRHARIDQVVDRLAAGGDGVVMDLVGVRGIGKTTFIGELVRRVPTHPRLDPGRTLLVQAPSLERSDMGRGYRDDYGPRASSAVLRETFDRSRAMLLELAKDAPADVFDGFRALCRRRWSFDRKWDLRNQVRFARGAQVGTVEIHGDTNGATAEDERRELIRSAQRSIDAAFADAWDHFASSLQVLICIDQFEQIADDEIGHWLVRMGQALRNTVVVVARVPTGHRFGEPGDRIIDFPLPELTQVETGELLQRRLARAGLGLGEGIAEVTYDFTGGHPGGIDIISRLLVERPPVCVTAADLRRQLARLPDDGETWWAELVNALLEVADSPVLERSVAAAAVVTSFDEPLMDVLLADDDQDRTGRRGSDAVRELTARGLVHQVRTADGRPTGTFRMPEFLRRSVDARLRSLQTTTWLTLHERAAAHFFARLAAWDDKPTPEARSYGAYYKYEDLDWQRCKREWLQHLAPVVADRETTRARFLLLFLEAFFWWGCYVPSDFNRRLLEDWDRIIVNGTGGIAQVGTEAARHEHDQVFGEGLTFLLDHYPTGGANMDDAPWSDIRRHLVRVGGLCDLAHPTAHGRRQAEVADVRRAGAFLDLFLAQTYRFEDPAHARATTRYQQATERFRAEGDWWMTAWALFEQADLARVRREHDRVRDLVAESARLVPATVGSDGYWDHELLSCLHRVRADLAGDLDDVGAAGRHFGWAISDAYRFQGEAQTWPDTYTQQFYVETVERCGDALAAAAGRGRAPELLAALRAALADAEMASVADVDDLVTAGRWREVVERLVPAAPADDELYRVDTAFRDRWLEAQLDAPEAERSIELLVAELGAARP